MLHIFHLGKTDVHFTKTKLKTRQGQCHIRHASNKLTKWYARQIVYICQHSKTKNIHVGNSIRCPCHHDTENELSND